MAYMVMAYVVMVYMVIVYVVMAEVQRTGSRVRATIADVAGTGKTLVGECFGINRTPNAP